MAGIVDHETARTEDSLMRRATTGDGPAMEQLYALTANALFTYLRRLGSSAADADEVLQTTFMNVWRSRSRFRGTGARAWLFSIARNAYLSHVGNQGQPGGKTLPSPSPPTTPPEHFAATDLSRRIDAALSKLPELTSEALVLSRVSGLSVRDIAALLGLSEGNVRVRIHRGLSQLKEAISS